MNGRIINTLVAKELKLYSRNRFFAFVTVLSIVAYIVIYFVMPDIDEEINLLLYAPQTPQALLTEFGDEGLAIDMAASLTELETAVLEGDYSAGIVIHESTIADLSAGRPTEIDLYFAANTPQELTNAITTIMSAVFNNISYNLSGDPLTITVNEEILGPDLIGTPIPPRDRMLPLFVILLLLMEPLGLSSLIVEEIAGRTLRALLITPMKMWHLFVGKGIAGMLLAFVPVTTLMFIIGGLKTEPLLIIVALLLGSFMATGLGFLLAAVGHDMLSVMGWGILVMLILALPAFAVIFPFSTSIWIELIPSYYLVETINLVANFNAGWADVGSNLMIMLAWGIGFLLLGIYVLGRKMR